MPTEGQLQQLQLQFQLDAPLNAVQIARYESIRTKCLSLAIDLTDLIPLSDERDTSIKLLNEVMFWANAGVTRHLV